MVPPTNRFEEYIARKLQEGSKETDQRIKLAKRLSENKEKTERMSSLDVWTDAPYTEHKVFCQRAYEAYNCAKGRTKEILFTDYCCMLGKEPQQKDSVFQKINYLHALFSSDNCRRRISPRLTELLLEDLKARRMNESVYNAISNCEDNQELVKLLSKPWNASEENPPTEEDKNFGTAFGEYLLALTSEDYAKALEANKKMRDIALETYFKMRTCKSLAEDLDRGRRNLEMKIQREQG